MGTLVGSRYIISISAAAALLAGCATLRQAQGDIVGSGGPSMMIPQARSIAPRLDGERSWMLPEAKSDHLLYITNSTKVEVYSYPRGAPVGEITDLTSPYGDCTDKKGNVYITDLSAGTVTEYAHGGTQPIRTLSVPGNGAFECAVDPKSGDLAVTSEGSNGSGVGGDVAIFRNATGTPQVFTSSSFLNYEYCAYDKRGNLFVDGTYPRGYNLPILAELPRGASSLTIVNVDYEPGWIAGVQWAGKYLAYGQGVKPKILQFAVNGSSATEVGATPLTDAYWLTQFIIAGKKAIVVNIHFEDRYIYRWDVLVFDYPAGGSETLDVIDSGSTIGSVALSR